MDFEIQWNPITIQLCMLGPWNPGCSLKELYNKVFRKGGAYFNKLNSQMNVWTELEFNLYFVGGASTNKPVSELSILIIILLLLLVLLLIIIILYYPLPLWGFSAIMKQIIQIEHNMVKNPNWFEANQLFILQVWPRTWTPDYRVQIQLVLRMGLELWTSELQVQCFNHSATLPP